MDTFGKMIASILVVFLIFVNPLPYLLESENAIEFSYIQSLGTEFVNEVCNSGEITLEQYERLQTKIMQTGEIYDVEMEHTHLEVGVVSDEVGEKVKVNNCYAYRSSDATVMVNVQSKKTLSSITVNLSKDIIDLNEAFPITSVTLHYDNGEQETVTSGWSVTGFNNTVGGSQTVTVSYTKGTITKSADVTIFIRKLQSIQANVSTYTVQKYTELPVKSLTLTYNDGITQNVTSGWSYSGYDPNARGEYNVNVQYQVNGVTCSTDVTITVTNLICACPFCGKNYECDDNDVDNGCQDCKEKIVHLEVNPSFLTIQRGGALDIVVEAVYRDGHQSKVSGWTSNYDSDRLGGQIVTIQYQEMQAKITVRVVERELCPYCNNYYEYDSESEAACPYCSKQIVALSVTPDDLKVNYGEQLSITVTATYLDGHTQVVTDYDSTYDRYSIGVQYIKISYGSIFAQIIVEVVKPSITCSICNREYDGSIYTSGCPYCSREIVSIHASLINARTKVQLGSDLILRVVVAYRDNHREAKYSGYTVEGYDCNLMGVQTVRVIYHTYSCTLTIEVVNEMTKVVCPNGHVYSLNEDQSNAGCPYCVTESANKEMSYLKISYTDEILEKLEQEGVYLIPSGDYISVTIRHRETKNSGNPLRQLTKMDVLYVKKEYAAGGEIK